MLKYFYNIILTFAAVIQINAENSTMYETFSIYPVYNETYQMNIIDGIEIVSSTGPLKFNLQNFATNKTFYQNIGKYL